MITKAQRQSLVNRIDEFEHLLYQDEFWIDDIGEEHHKSQSILEMLKVAGAIESQGRVKREGKSKPVNRWKWVNHREYLKDYLEERNELPCGCRGHVPPEQDGDTYYCKFCGSAHPREVIENAL
jgi:hypothetical protein